ncbi:MAG: ATP-binding protein [Calditrichaeota bacterium]|nr:MAG: ATP-binding protein [Calditrichota bacterium]
MNSKRKKNTFRIRFPSSTENLETIRDIVKKLALKAGCSGDEADNIALAVDEACTNVIKHAHKFNARRMIDLAVIYTSEKFEVIITDKGKGFDPSKMPKPDLDKYVHEARKGGLGIHLMKTLMDEVSYTFNPGVKNQVSLIKYITVRDT